MIVDATHFARTELKFVNGRLHQLWLPRDGSTHEPEWREVPSEDFAPTEPVIDLSETDTLRSALRIDPPQSFN